MAIEPRVLAIDGGEPAFGSGPPGWPPVEEDIRAALEKAYRTGDWGRYHGHNHAALTAAISTWLGIEHVQLCCSGTIAVELALRGVGIPAGGEVVLAAYDFPGNFRAIEAAGGRPVLVDIDPHTWCLDADSFAEAVSTGSANVRAVIVSHLHGGLVDMDAVATIARDRGIAIVEDACQCPGASVHGELAGTLGDVGVFSFGGSKLLTAGRGGAIVTRDPAIAQRARIHAERGNAAFPLSELQAAVLLPQLSRLPHYHEVRRRNARRLLKALAASHALSPVRDYPTDRPAYYKIALSVARTTNAASWREEFLRAAHAEGLDLGPGFRGFATRPTRRCRKVGDLRYSRRAAEATLLLHHPVLLDSEATIDLVASTLDEIAHRLTDSANDD